MCVYAAHDVRRHTRCLRPSPVFACVRNRMLSTAVDRGRLPSTATYHRSEDATLLISERLSTCELRWRQSAVCTWSLADCRTATASDMRWRSDECLLIFCRRPTDSSYLTCAHTRSSCALAFTQVTLLRSSFVTLPSLSATHVTWS